MNRFIVVLKGHTTGIFTSEAQLKIAICNYHNPVFKCFDSLQDAQVYYDRHSKVPEIKICNKYFFDKEKTLQFGDPSEESICISTRVDREEGITHYNAVDTITSDIIFNGHRRFIGGSLNDFITIVDVFEHLDRKNKRMPIYTTNADLVDMFDSCDFEYIFKYVPWNHKAYRMLKACSKSLFDKYKKNNIILKDVILWQTDLWGAIPSNIE